MERTRQDYLNLLEETVKYYAENPKERRAFDEIKFTSCEYLTEDGKMCAVGRCLNQDKMDYDTYNVGKSVEVVVGMLTDKIFKPEYQGFNIKFWGALQTLHDGNCYWVENGLSMLGRQYVDELETEIRFGIEYI